MHTPAGDPIGLMVLRAWIEPGVKLRVRITWTVDVQSGQTITSYAASAGDTKRIVERWLTELGFPADPGERR